MTVQYRKIQEDLKHIRSLRNLNMLTGYKTNIQKSTGIRGASLSQYMDVLTHLEASLNSILLRFYEGFLI